MAAASTGVASTAAAVGMAAAAVGMAAEAVGTVAAGTGTAGAAAVGQVRPSLAVWLLARCLAAPICGYGNGYGYGGCTSYAPIYDAYGNYIGQQPVNGC